MDYTTQTEIEASGIPPQFLLEALDDNGDGTADDGLLAQIIATASNDVDGYLQGLYAVPFETPPAIVKTAALVFTCESLYARRQYTGKDNPWSARANALRARLDEIGKGNAPLSLDAESGIEAYYGTKDVVPTRT